MDFLPLDADDREALAQYQSQQSATRLVLVVEGDSLREEAVWQLADSIDCRMAGGQLAEPDPAEGLAAMYSQMPYRIADSVYARFDSIFTPQAVNAALLRDKAILAIPGASILSTAIAYDPLGLIELSTLNTQPSTLNSQPSTLNISFAFYDSSYGSTETQRNALLIDSLQTITDRVAQHFPTLHIRWTGAPVISVSNARRIKLDTILCISLSLVLIILLLAYSFPRRRDLWLILLSVSFGWLMGMAVLRIVTPTISAVVLGIGSVLIGIAVNYPLHLLVHQRYTSSVRQTLEEVLSPLVVGNITTVGAFLALIPLQATALRHLGIFASAMLVGTILFCIFVLPHLMSAKPTPVREIHLPVVPRPKHIAAGQWLVVALTIAMGAYLIASQMANDKYENSKWSNGKWFDSNLNHINYMSPEQRADMQAFNIFNSDSPASSTQSTRAEQWQTYWHTHSADSLVSTIRTEAVATGFRPDVFAPFYDLLTSWKPVKAFDMSKLTQRLSDDFDYIGVCCSLIVFAFLWLSFRNFWLALIAFVPMALSWVWILAIMQLFDIQFNIVNIILATFIFGQGDDYTIFIVEGLLYEHRTGKPILPQYRQSILLSALIMLIGVGILVLAVHPAMHSLGVVTLIGMSVVLLMAVTVPPMLFRLYVRLSRKPV
ncbi:MAG: MMPL family transporter [Paludibacteraceae bacterium]|nr:MMPL family transporter [Paludibacteraceae bacterium]